MAADLSTTMAADSATTILEFEPIFGIGGNTPATHDDVENCYNLILGRHPENIEIIREALGQPVHAVLKDMLTSIEFSDVIEPILSGKIERHSTLSKSPNESLLFWLNQKIIINSEFNRAVLSTRDWGDLLRLFLTRPEIAVLVHKPHGAATAVLPISNEIIQNESDLDDVLCFLDECSMSRMQGWAAYRSFPEKSVSLCIFIDDIYYVKTECNLPRPDLRAAGHPTLSGFKLQLQRRYFDGEKHRVRLEVEGRPIKLHVMGSVLSEHVFEGLWVPPLRSNVDGFDRGVIRGWALRASADSDILKGGLTVRVVHKEETIATLKADRFRPDVGQALSADNYCGFVFDPPYQLRRSSALTFCFYDLSDGTELANSPCTTSFGHDHREGKILALQDTLDRLSADITSLKNDLKSIISRKHHTINDYDIWFRSYVDVLRKQTETMRDKKGSDGLPLVSVICPTYRPHLDDFRAAVESVLDQTYRNWELIIVDDGSEDPTLSNYIANIVRQDSRIKLVQTSKNLRISGATNLAIDAASGDWIALFDHDDLLVDVALEVMISRGMQHGAKVLYSDEDKIDSHGYYSEPSMKPDWNYRFLLSCNYICHFLIFRRELISGIGKFRSKYDGAQDHDLILRLSEVVLEQEILHIPEILYHWRKTANSTASGISAKTYAVDAGINAVLDHLSRIGRSATVSSVLNATMYEITWKLQKNPVVHIIIPFRDQAAMTSKCLDAVLGLTKYENFRITLVDNWSNNLETKQMISKYVADPRVTCIAINEEFNYSRLNNRAANMFTSEFLFFMNNDLVVLDGDWLTIVLGEAISNPKVGAVGGKFFYPNGTIQHAGVVLGLWGVAGHVHTGLSALSPGYNARAILAQEVSAVTAAGMLVRTSVFNEIGQFDEVNLKVAFNDIDLCMKIREAGYKIVWTPSFVAEHHESLSRGQDDKPLKRSRFEDEIRYMQERWGTALELDKNYSRFFDTNGQPYFDLRDPTEIGLINEF